MADDKKKSKIDLKARLGKTGTLSGGAAAPVPLPVPGASAPGSAPPPPADSRPGAPAPAPSQGGSVRPPMGLAPPPGITPGLPAPLFAQPKKEREAKPSAQQQTIKVEVGEEIIKEREAARKRAALYAGIAAVVALGLGLAVGRVWQRGDNSTAAGKGAATLEKDVKAANET